MVGKTLGHYQVVEKIGAGGMGEVYRARDTHLNRDVALKTLPAAFAQNPERLARFEREAHLLASLNHPNIAAIHGFEQDSQECLCYLVLEYVPGEILRGPLPVDEALPVARQIIEALEEAHGKGVVHRDLKPANIKITPEGKVKVLDFGLAKALSVEPASSAGANSPTLTVAATGAGVLLGTAAYMSPEQARGKPADKRADVWAFGCVLYELLAGRQAFHGQSLSDTLSAVLRAEPDWSALPPETPEPLGRLLRRCLQKDAGARLHDIADARLEVQDALSSPPPALAPAPPSPLRSLARFLPWALAAVGIAVAVWSLSRPRPPASPSVTRLAVPLPPGERFIAGAVPALALSPDGTRLVYALERKQGPQLYLRRLDRFDAVPIPGTEGASGPFFSPDGEWVGFTAGGKLKKVLLSGGAPVNICDVQDIRGAAWAPDDTIIFTRAFTGAIGLSRVSAAGGVPQPLTTPDPKQREFGHRWPEVLPGGKAVLFTIWLGGSFDNSRIGVVSLQTGERRILLEGGYSPRYAPAGRPGQGYLVFARAGGLLAAPMDLVRLQTTGQPVPILEPTLMNTRTGAANYSLSSTGVLVYLPGSGQAAELTLAWVDRKGEARPLTQTRRVFDAMRLSPDGRRVATAVVDGGGRNIWVYDLARDTLARLTFDSASADAAPVWTPDGRLVTFSSARSGAGNLFWKPADGSGSEQRLTTSPHTQFPTSWSPDGKWLAFEQFDPVTQSDIWVLPRPDGASAEQKPRQFLKTSFSERGGRFSPNGRWLAYYSNESGQNQVYVQPFPGPGGKSQVSTDGGLEPMWATDGRELFYRNADRIMAVDVTTAPSFSAGKPRLLFERQYEFGPAFTNWDVAPDGRQFLMLKGSDAGAPGQVNVVLNWR